MNMGYTNKVTGFSTLLLTENDTIKINSLSSTPINIPNAGVWLINWGFHFTNVSGIDKVNVIVYSIGLGLNNLSYMPDSVISNNTTHILNDVSFDEIVFDRTNTVYFNNNYIYIGDATNLYINYDIKCDQTNDFYTSYYVTILRIA
jgi:hypothetical protein